MKKRMAIIFTTGLIMTGMLTACQKSEGEMKEQSGQIEMNATETSEIEPQTASQGTNILADSLPQRPEFQACAEWKKFLNEYDTDKAILLAMEVEDETKEGEYAAYACYSEEMEKKVDEICEKYGLIKLGGYQYLESCSELCNKAEIGVFCEDSGEAKHTDGSSYFYEDGTFLFEGNVTFMSLPDYEASYQFIRAVKGTFNAADLDFGDFTEYNVREYTTRNGEKVLFVCKAETNPSIIVERNKSFVIVRGYGDLSGISDANDEKLEKLAEAFDFAAIP